MPNEQLRSFHKVISALCLIAAIASQAVWAGHVNFVFGDRNLEEDFEPIDGQDTLGVVLFLEKDRWPVALALGLYRSDSDRESGTAFNSLLGPGTSRVVSESTELSVGVIKIWEKSPRAYPFIGGGLTLVEMVIKAETSGLDVFDDGRAVGLYANVGAFWRLGTAFNLGVDVRLVRDTEVKLFGEKFDADYIQFGWITGWGW
ncbi:MAG: hypothetical protein V3U86_00360 [Acidobacteriota bacterium]